MNRRRFVETCLGLIASAAVIEKARGGPEKEDSTRRAIPFGAAVQSALLDRDRRYRHAVLQYCRRATPEFEFQWDQVETAEAVFNFAHADRVANFGRDNKIEVCGHTMIWHRSVPAWAEMRMREGASWPLVARHLDVMMRRYGGVRFWAVVNEPIDTGYRQDGLRPSVFLQAFGEAYIEMALRTARQASSSALLLINEYGLEYDFQVEKDRRYLLLKLLERLRRAQTPLDGVGLQAHLDLRKGRVSQPDIAAFLKEIADLGLFVYVTELDVTEADYFLPVAQRDAIVADEVARYLDVVLDFPDVRGVTTWGLTDRFSWLEIDPARREKFEREGYWRDGTSPGLNRGLPLDAQFQPKPFLEQLLKHGVAPKQPPHHGALRG